MKFSSPKNKTFITDFFLKKIDGEWWLCGEDKDKNYYKIGDSRLNYKSAKADMLYCKEEYLKTRKWYLCWLERKQKYILSRDVADVLEAYGSGWHIVYKAV